jgi:MFS family permease
MGERHRILTKADIEKTKKYSIGDACGYAVMDGFGGQYVVPFALKLGASSAEVGVLSSLPYFLSSLAQLAGVKIAEVCRSRKKAIAIFAFLQGVTLIPLFIIPFLTKNIFLLTLLFSLYLMFEGFAAPAWNSLIGDVILSERVEYFARRNKAHLIVLLISMMIAGITLSSFSSSNIWLGFWTLFTIAIFGRTASVIFLLFHHEPLPILPPEKPVSLVSFLRKLNDNNFGNFVVFKSIFTCAIMVGSPFFAVYMLKTLSFSYVKFSMVILVSLAARAISSPYWARYSSKYGTRNMLYVSSVLVAAIPLNWFIIGFFLQGTDLIFWFIFAAEIFTGFAWAGFDLTSFNYMLETTESSSRARMFAYFNSFFGFFYLIGGLLGAYLVGYLNTITLPFSTLLVVLFISFVLRISTTLLLIGKVKEIKVHMPLNQRKLLIEVGLMRPLQSSVQAILSRYQLIESEIERKINRDDVNIEDEIARIHRRIEKMLPDDVSKPLKTQARKK